LLLLFLLAVAQGPTERAADRPHDLTNYLAIAADYRSANHAAALREIRQWPRREVTAVVDDLRRQGRRLRSATTDPGDIVFGTVEAAVLMHAEAGLLSLGALRKAEAETHLGASVTLYQWSRNAAVELRNWAEARRRAFEEPPTPGPEIVPSIARRDFYVALAAGALSLGFPDTAEPFAAKARQAAPLDPEVQLLYGCVAEGLAEQQFLRHREKAVTAWRDQAEGALRDAIALDGSLLEARLHLGKIRLDSGRLIQAEPRLQDVEANARDDRQRYLARLFLGRLAERRGQPDEAARFYRQALQAWPDSQAARLGLGHALERSAGPAAARPLVASSLAASQRLFDRAADPWWLYLFGPPGLAEAARDRVWREALDR
jgi:tetratricopeptide (TPR) repeat protein